MRIKMKVDISGTRDGGGDWPRRGGEIEVSDGEGADLIASDMAVEVKPEKKAEKKAEPDVETADADTSDVETTALTTDTGPAKRGPGRPRKNV